MFKTLDSYQKAALDVLEHIEKDPTIFLINSAYFRIVINMAEENFLYHFDHVTYDYISITDYIPNIYQEIKAALPYPKTILLKKDHLVTELVGQYGVSWIPIVSPDYLYAIETSYDEDMKMYDWQRYLRSTNSNNKIELTILSLDPDKSVRDTALQRLKTL